jgi:hypothetical protein
MLAGFLAMYCGTEPECVQIRAAVKPPEQIGSVEIAGKRLFMVAVSDTIVYVCYCKD